MLGTKLDIVTCGRLLSWSPGIRSCRPRFAPIKVRNAKSANDIVVMLVGTGESQEQPVSTSEFESVKKIVESVDVAVDIVEDCERGGVAQISLRGTKIDYLRAAISVLLQLCGPRGGATVWG